MPALPNPSRRHALKILAGAPMLPLSGVALPALLSGCGGGDDVAAAPPAASFAAAAFASMAAPTLADPAAMATTTVGSTLSVSFTDGSTRNYKLAYRPFFVTGDRVPDGKGGTILAGGYYDINNQPIIDRSVPGQERQFYSDCPDGSSLLTLKNASVAGVKGNTVFAVVQFEYTTRDQASASQYGRLPSPIAVLTLDQDPATGALKLVKYHNVDTSAAHGLWITCGASLSPWNTHLSSEEYEPDATKAASDAQFKAFSKNTFGSETAANPYHYGHLPEVTVNPDGTGSIRKHYCLGRISHELVQVMPDQRTVLMGDDATNGGLFMFVADQAADLSAGTLYVAKWTQKSSAGAGAATLTWINLGHAYVAKWTQKSSAGAGAATLTWINLGHATSAEIEALANQLKAADIMDVATKDPGDASFTKINFSGTFNWVRIKPGMTKAAAFLETHRYAAYAGGSMGFTKLEGTTVNAKDKVLYSAMSYIQKSMVRGNAAASPDIALDRAINAGAVYALNLRGGQRDTAAPRSRANGARRHERARGARRRGPRRGRCARQHRESGQDRESGQPEVLGKVAHPLHRRGFGDAREQLPVGVQRRHEAALARAVVPGGRGVDGPARSRRDQWLDLRDEQLPARRRLGIAAARQGEGRARSARARELQGPLRRVRRLSAGRPRRDPAREGLIPPDFLRHHG
nr:alkaline phosphatase PhoX [Burkholderia thailandensis]